MHRVLVRALLPLPVIAAGFAAGPAWAGGAEYLIPGNGDSVIGTMTTVIADQEDTILDIARRHGIGYEEIMSANPGVDPWIPGAGTEILIPSRYVLPDAPRTGVVINLAEHRLYYYPPVKQGEPPVVRTSRATELTSNPSLISTSSSGDTVGSTSSFRPTSR